MNTQIQSLILASASKTRSQILLNAGIVFRVQVADIDEKEVKQKFRFKHLEELASELAYQKADKISRSCEDSLVIGADQILECDGVLFNKPTTKKEVVSHLKFLRGKTHRLVSAVCVIFAEVDAVATPVNVLVPVVIPLPDIVPFPVTVKLSATVVSEVVCPIVIAIPLVSVANFNAPVLFAKYEFDPS